MDDVRAHLAAVLDKLGRQAVHLNRTIARLETGGELDPLERLDVYEALTSRFARLQDLLLAPFRAIARLEYEEQAMERVPDLLNLMEKRGIVGSAQDWAKMRELRNAIAHEYWDNEQERDELFALCLSYSRSLLEILERVRAYVVQHGLV
jgi:hypothetical protein